MAAASSGRREQFHREQFWRGRASFGETGFGKREACGFGTRLGQT